MRSEIEKLIEFWRQVADNGGGGYRHCADDLQRVLDADPVARLEAMGYRCEMDIDRETNLPVLDVYPVGTTGGPHFSEILVAGLSCHEQITDAATRLLARIEKEGE